MKRPVPAEGGGAGAKVNESQIHRPFYTPRPARQTRTIDVPPNWRRRGSIIDDMIADLEPRST